MNGRVAGARYGALFLFVGACTTADPKTEPVARSTAADVAGCAEPLTFAGVDWCVTRMGENGSDNDIPITGSVALNGDSLSITSDGDGLTLAEDGDAATDDDGLLYVYTPVPHATDGQGQSIPRDVELVVHFTMPAAAATKSQLGVMIRDSVAGKSPRGAGLFSMGATEWNAPVTCDGSDIHLGSWRTELRSSIPGQGLVMGSGGIHNGRVGADFYMRIQRIGKDFAVQHSVDGNDWAAIGGGALTNPDSLIGFFIAGNGSSPTATVDRVYLGPPRLDYRSTWIGSSLVQHSTDYIAFGMHDVYVAPDGTIYKYSEATDPNRELTVINADGSIRPIAYGSSVLGPGFYQGGIAGDPSAGEIYVARRADPAPCHPGSYVERRHAADASPITGAAPLEFGATTLGLIGGLAAARGKVYLSDVAVNDTLTQGQCAYSPTPVPPTRASTIRIHDTSDPTHPSQFDFTDRNGGAATPGSLAVDDGGDIWIVQQATDYPVLGLGACTNVNSNKKQCPDPAGTCYPADADRDLCPCTAERSSYPGMFNIKREGVVQCRHPDGTRCVAGQSPIEITNSVAGYAAGGFNPVGVSVDPGANPASAGDDRLIIADNGQHQNLLICQNLHSGSPTCNTFGVQGGVFAGSTPGLVNDPAAGGSARFFSPLKGAVDASGNIYVGSSAPRVDIRKFTASGSLLWARYGLGTEPGSFDPDSDGHDYYTTTRHYTFDTSQTAPGSEWAVRGVSWNPFGAAPPGDRYADTLYSGGIAFGVRRLAQDNSPSRQLFGFQNKNNNEQRFYRYNGEVATLFGSFDYIPIRDGDSCDESVPDIDGCLRLWIDADGDGVEDRGTDPDPCKACLGFSGVCEVKTVPMPSSPSTPSGTYVSDIDARGDLRLAFPDRIWEFHRTWPADAINPSYAMTPTEVLIPSTLGRILSIHFDAASPDDSMYLVGTRPGLPAGCTGTNDPCWCWAAVIQVVRYDHFHSTPVLAPGYPVVLPAPENLLDVPDPTVERAADRHCAGCALDRAEYRGFDQVGGLFFVQRRTGDILVYDAQTGTKLQTLYAGAELSGDESWTDSSYPGSIHAFKRNNGEYLITNLDSNNQARTIVFRYTPPSTRAWTPASLAPIAWYKAGSDELTVANGHVAQWNDRSGHGHHLTNGTDAGRPAYDAAGWNSSKPSVTFNGSALLSQAGWGDVPTGTDQPFTVLAVVETQASSPAGAVVSWWNSNDGSDVRCNLAPQGNDAVLDITRGSGNANDQHFTGTSALAAGRHVVAWRFAPNTFTLSGDGSSQTSSAQSPFAGLSFDTFTMGAKTTLPTGLFTGKVAEVVVVPSAVADADIARFGDYAQATWGGLTGNNSSWTPSALTPLAWYAADPAHMTIASGHVAQWNDLSGHGHDLVNTFEPGRPAYDASGWNSAAPAVVFNGGSLLRFDGWTGLPGGTDQPFSVLAVVETQTTTAESALLAFWHSAGGYDVRCNLVPQGNSSLLGISRGEGSSTDQTFTGTTAFAPGRHVVAWRFSPNTFTLTVDGISQTSQPQAPVVPLSFDTLVLGAKTTLPTGLFAGKVTEVVVAPSVVADADVAHFEEYAHTRWGGF